MRDKNATLCESGKMLWIEPHKIVPNPDQPRRAFEPRALEELSHSISLYGVLQPLTVRRRGADFELISGERRLRAARMAGLRTVPCVVLSVDSAQSSLLALVENLQRRDLDFVEEARGLARLMQVYGLSQEQVARRLGKSQPTVANKLRLLRHPPELLDFMLDHGLTERHARALLSLEDEGGRMAAAQHIAGKNLNVAQTEQYVESLIKRAEDKASSRSDRTIYVLKDVRLFLNTLERAVSLMRRAGVAAEMERRDDSGGISLSIRIPGARAEREVRRRAL